MRKIIIFFIVTVFAINIKSTKEEELKTIYSRIKVIEEQIKKSHSNMEKILFIRQKKQFQDELESIKKSLPEGLGELIIKDLEVKSKTTK